MISMSSARQVTLQVLTDRFYTIRYHWRGRSLLCSGDENCVGCRCDRARAVHYIGASIRFDPRRVKDGGDPPMTGIVELCQSARVVIEREYRRFNKMVGLCVSMRRRSSKSEWEQVDASVREPGNRILDPRDVMMGLSAVLRVDDPAEGEQFETWLRRVSVMHRGLMRGTQLV
jgi:hypothetical protein